jgi:hypothetical protein
VQLLQSLLLLAWSGCVSGAAAGVEQVVVTVAAPALLLLVLLLLLQTLQPEHLLLLASRGLCCDFAHGGKLRAPMF